MLYVPVSRTPWVEKAKTQKRGHLRTHGNLAIPSDSSIKIFQHNKTYLAS